MNKLPILKYPNKTLREKARKVKLPLEPEIQKLIPRMAAAMQASNGMGLAAPQVGKALQLCVVLEIDEAGRNNKVIGLHTMINPKITAFSKNKVVMEEGCLSFPGKYFPISRPESVKVRYLDDQGNKCKIKAKGMFSRTIQHEIDHLSGILLIDRAK